jgi:hypothetical protein
MRAMINSDTNGYLRRKKLTQFPNSPKNERNGLRIVS